MYPFSKLCYYHNMANSHERVLIVDSDPEINDLIARQTLEPSGFRVEVVVDATQAIQMVPQFIPDVILVELGLPGLSGKDLLVALNSQGIDVPVVMIAGKGMEGDVIQAFRLGASDYLMAPIREAEVLAVVERALKQVRARREREQLSRQLNQTNQELQRRVRELTTIFAIGKAVTSITSQRALFEKIVEGAIYVTEADCGWLLLREDRSKPFLLCASRNLPEAISLRIGTPWEEDVNALVALSGESLSIFGEPLKRFQFSSFGQAALVVPVKVKKEVVGLLVVMRKSNLAFSPSNQTLIEAVADYASISLVNAQLFRALEERARSLQHQAVGDRIGERIRDEIIQDATEKIREISSDSLSTIDLLSQSPQKAVNAGQEKFLKNLKKNNEQVLHLLKMLAAVKKGEASQQKTSVDLTGLLRQITTRFQPMTQAVGISLFTELPAQPVVTWANTGQISWAYEGLLNRAIYQCSPGSMITTCLTIYKESQYTWAHISVKDNGQGLTVSQLAHVFEPGFREKPSSKTVLCSLGISLPLIREIVLNHGGKVWAESEAGKGSTFHVDLPVHHLSESKRR